MLKKTQKTETNLTTCETRILPPAQIFLKNKVRKDFPGGPVLKNLPSNAGDTVWPLAREDPTCRGATKPMSCNYWSLSSRARARQQEKPLWIRSPRTSEESSLCLWNWRKPECRNHDPAQLRANKHRRKTHFRQTETDPICRPDTCSKEMLRQKKSSSMWKHRDVERNKDQCMGCISKFKRADSLEKTLMLGKREGGRRRGRQEEMAGWHHRLDGHESE